MKLFLLLSITITILLALSLPTLANDPTNAGECKSMLRSMLVEKCNTLFAKPDQADAKKSCLDNVSVGLETCDQFFGQNSDFCAVCTNNCISNYQETDPKRKDCLQMCLTHEGCKK